MWIWLILWTCLALSQSFALSPIEEFRQVQKAIKKLQKQSHRIDHFEELRSKMREKCSMTINQSNSFFVFQTPRGAYLAINQDEGLQFYTWDCQFVSNIMNVSATHLVCDRSLCDDGSIVLATTIGQVLICQQKNLFNNCSVVYEVPNSYICDIVVRNKVKVKPNIFITYSQNMNIQPTSIIAVYVEERSIKKIQMERGSQIAFMLEMHPYPIIISNKGWIYHFHYDTLTLHISTCPHPLHSIDLAVVNHPYQQIVYLVSSNKVTAIEVKPKMKCRNIMSTHLEEINLNSQNKINVGEFENHIYVGNQVIGVQDGKIEKVCGNNSQVNLLLMKNKYRKGQFAYKCCHQNNKSCSLTILTTKVQEQEKQTSFMVIVIPIFIIFIIILCFITKMKSSSNKGSKTKTQKISPYENEVSLYLKKRALKKQ